MWILHTEIHDYIQNGRQNVNFLIIHIKHLIYKNADFIMLVNSELNGKHDEALNSTCNSFLLREPKIVTKNDIFYTDLLPGLLLKQKIFCCTHTHYEKGFFIV